MEKKYIHGDDVVDSTSTDDSGTPTSSLNNNPELPITRVYNRDPESSNWWTESDTGIGALAGLATGAAALLVGSTAMAARLIFGSRTRRLVYRHIGIKGRYDPSIPRTAFIFSYDLCFSCLKIMSNISQLNMFAQNMFQSAHTFKLISCLCNTYMFCFITTMLCDAT